MNISEALPLWKERLADECKYRIAIKCDHKLNLSQICRIQNCPLLCSYAKLDMKVIYEFEDRKR